MFASGTREQVEQHSGIALVSGNGAVRSDGMKGAHGSAAISDGGDVQATGRAGGVLSVDQVGHVEVADRPDGAVLHATFRRDLIEPPLPGATLEVRDGQLL